MKRSLRRLLRQRGATTAEIDAAVEHGYLVLLVLDRCVMPGERRHSMEELARRAGTDLRTAQTLWRALGFPDLAADVRAFTDADVEALRGFVRRIEAGVFDWTLDRALGQARVLSSSLARVADSETDELVRSVQLARDAGIGDEDLALLVADRFDFDEIARLLDHTHRLQLRAAMWRRMAGVGPTTPGSVDGAVGFVDLVGYTALAKQLTATELASLVARFADLAHHSAVEAGARIVKTIGDEVMFVSDTSSAAAMVALVLVDRTDRDELLPPARAGVALGALLARDGDYFGPVVNLASRLTEMARPGSVLASREVVGALAPPTGIQARRVGTRRLRDIGAVEVFRLRRP